MSQSFIQIQGPCGMKHYSNVDVHLLAIAWDMHNHIIWELKHSLNINLSPKSQCMYNSTHNSSKITNKIIFFTQQDYSQVPMLTIRKKKQIQENS